MPNAIQKAGYDIKDIKGVIMGYLHLDHAGGLEHFMGIKVLGTHSLYYYLMGSIPTHVYMLGFPPELRTAMSSDGLGLFIAALIPDSREDTKDLPDSMHGQ